MLNPLLKKLFFDVSLIILSGCLVFALASWLDIFESLLIVTEPYEYVNADELIFALIAMMFMAGVLIFFRTRQYYSEMTLSHRLRENLDAQEGMYSDDTEEALTLLFEVDKELERLRKLAGNELSAAMRILDNIITARDSATGANVAMADYRWQLVQCRKRLSGIKKTLHDTSNTQRHGWEIQPLTNGDSAS